MPTTLVAHEQPISRIFSNDYVFRIPPYQRPLCVDDRAVKGTVR